MPVLDQWIEEGRNVDPPQLRRIIKELRHYRHFKHALEISQWMTDKRYMILSPSDIAVRLNLIGKVHGIEQVENLFNSTPKQFKTLEVYGALLRCYSDRKCVDKAEAVMQQMEELGFALSTLNYNVMLNHFFQTANREKADSLLHEMEAKRVKFDRFTYALLLNAYGADSDTSEMEKILTRVESDPDTDIDWNVYAVAANQYIRAGLVNKALDLLKKSEKLVAFVNKKKEAFSFILTLYAAAGKKEDVLRTWEKCKQYNASNMNYKKMLSSILKFDDLETAEKVFKEWEHTDLSKDIKIPNFLICTYCKKGMMDKAEALIEKVKSKQWQKPDLFTWSYMSIGYVRCNQMPKAVEALKSAVSEFYPRGRWKPDKETLAACLKHLKEEGDLEGSIEFIRLLQDKGIIPVEVRDRLLEYVSGESAGDDALEGFDLGADNENLEAKLMKDFAMTKTI